MLVTLRMRVRSPNPEIFSPLLLFLSSVAFSSLLSGASFLSFPKVDQLSWPGKWSALQDFLAQVQSSITATHVDSLGALHPLMSLWNCVIVLLILYHSSGSCEDHVSFSVLFPFFAFFCEDHSYSWEQLIFIILIVPDGETNTLGNFTKAGSAKNSYSTEQENKSCEHSCSIFCKIWIAHQTLVKELVFKSMQLIKR